MKVTMNEATGVIEIRKESGDAFLASLELAKEKAKRIELERKLDLIMNQLGIKEG